MGTIADKLEYLNDTKTAIKGALQNRGVAVSDTDTFRSYADKIGDIGETVEKTKFGASIDSFLGDVDANGVYQKPSEFVLNLAGVKKTTYSGTFQYAFANTNCTKAIANDLIHASNNSFQYAFYNCGKLEEALFESLEEIVNGFFEFHHTFSNCNNLKSLKFSKLRTVSGGSVFQGSVDITKTFNVEEIFPVLEEISGSQVFDSFLYYPNYASARKPIIFPSVKKITGHTSQYSSTFGTSYNSGLIWHFPSATQFTGYIWNISSSYTGEIHFAAANREAIEACDGYANKWGFVGATIYFDL